MSQTVVKFPAAHRPAGIGHRITEAWHAARAAYRLAATRRQLGTLDDRALADIGISRAQAQFVAEAPIWDVLR